MRTTILSLICAMGVACGGSSPEPKTPTTDSADTTSSTPTPEATPADVPKPAADTPKSEPVKTSAVSNTSDGSDIIPPFTAQKPADDDSTAKPAAAADPPKKKGAAKAKKKAKAPKSN